VTQLPSDSSETVTPQACPSCGGPVRVTLIRREHLVFYACDACKAVGAYSLPERTARLRKRMWD